MKQLKNTLLRCAALALTVLMLLAFTACSQQDVQAIEDVIEIAEGLSVDSAAQSEAPSESTVIEPTATPTTSAAPSDIAAIEPAASPTVTSVQEKSPDAPLAEDGTYTTKDDVALYIYTYNHLPKNFITKKQAQALGWPGGDLEPYAPGKCIGGSYYGNYEGNLPEAKGREYTECDIDTLGAKKRGAKRIVFSDDGLIYYTEDHYNTFELLYGEP